MVPSINKEKVLLILKKLQKQKQFSNNWNISWRLGIILKELIELYQPKKVLEIGTSNGFSTLFMSLGLKLESKITTIEINEERQNQAKLNFKDAEIDFLVEPILGNVFEVLDKNKLNSYFDFIFLDAAHQDYLKLVKELIEKKLIKKETILVCDNVLSHSYMRKFISEVENLFSSSELIEIDSGFLVLKY